MSLILFISIFISAVLAEPTPWQVKFNSYVKGLPADVISFLERAESCNHFGGEEPYNEQRKNEILEAVTKLKCDSVDKDRDALLKKYEKQNQIGDKIKNFPEALN